MSLWSEFKDQWSAGLNTPSLSFVGAMTVVSMCILFIVFPVVAIILVSYYAPVELIKIAFWVVIVFGAFFAPVYSLVKVLKKRRRHDEG